MEPLPIFQKSRKNKSRKKIKKNQTIKRQDHDKIQKISTYRTFQATMKNNMNAFYQEEVIAGYNLNSTAATTTANTLSHNNQTLKTIFNQNKMNSRYLHSLNIILIFQTPKRNYKKKYYSVKTTSITQTMTPPNPNLKNAPSPKHTDQEANIIKIAIISPSALDPKN